METQNGGRKLKELVKSGDFGMRPHVYNFSIRNYTLVLFIHCFYIVVGIFCQPAYKNNRKTQTLMMHNSKTKEFHAKILKCLHSDACSILVSVVLVETKSFVLSNLFTNIKKRYRCVGLDQTMRHDMNH